MIYAEQDEVFEAVVDNGPTGLVGSITLEVYDPTDPTPLIVAASTAGIVEVRPGTYVKNLSVAPAGTFRVRWRYVIDGEAFTAEEDLVIGDTDTGELPSVSQVALLLRTRTVGDVAGGLGGDTQSTDVTTFTSSTRPTADEVLSIILTSKGAVDGMVRTPVPDNQRESVKHAVALYSAILIETSFFRENSNADALAALRGMLRDTVGAVNEQVVLSQGYGYGTLNIGTPLALSRLSLSNDVVPGLDD